MAQPKEEVIISGIGAMFPECNNMDEFKEFLFQKSNGVTIDSRKWNTNDPGKIHGTGKLKDAGQFDSTFFNAHPKLTENMDPSTMVFLERSVEAIIDAGLSPLDLHGTNTAVFAGYAISETEVNTFNPSNILSFTMLGCSRTMQANRVSYILNLTGPSYCMDGGWVCGSNSLERAKKLIEDGIVSAAIVGTTNLIFKQEIQYQFQGLNRLNRNDRTKSFSSDADGYNRSEACVVMLLQRASEAKRSYGTLLGVKSRQFGDNENHLMDHAQENFKSLLLECYREANVDPATIEFVEAHGSGIKCEDSMELNVMDEVFCTGNRKTPLKVGSVKSNVGHCEAVGLFVSMAKAIIALDGGYVPPNINYASANENAAALKTGKIQVVTEKTRLTGDVVGISSFGTINAFSHVIIRGNNKVKRTPQNIDRDDILPRLLFASGRTEENALNTIQKIKIHGNDEEFVALTNNVFMRNINAHFYRSFSIYPNLDDSHVDDVWNVNLKKRPVWFIFSGMGSQWHGMGTHLMKLPVFADAINKCDVVLKPHGVDIKDILTSQNPKIFDNILNSFVGIAAVQIGLVEVLRALDVTPDGIVGHSVGELGCAYADGCFTAEEMILSAHARGRASLETELIPGMMAAIGLGYDQIKDKLPSDIDVACHNSNNSCTISGPVDSIEQFVSKLKSDGIFAKSVNVAGIAYHSRYIQSAGPTLLKYLKEANKKNMAQPKEEVIISGIGAMFPECNNMDEFKEFLFQKSNGVTIDSRKWNTNDPGKIHGTGKLKDAGQFDSTFFNAHPKLTENMDPSTMVFLERSVEAIIDAGLSPLDLHGTNTAVFAGYAISETEVNTFNPSNILSFTMLGCSRTMQANRVSYILNLTGPSYCMDGGWVCGSNSLERAKKLIEDGIVSAAIVGTTNLIFKQEIQYQFQGLNRLNRNDRTKSFSSDADGYNRSEACVVMLLQRASEAKRSYGTLLGVKSRQFGDNENHLMDHAQENFKSLLLECYREANVDPATIEFVEAHGSGIKCEDSMELNVMDEVFCTGNRKTPLKVGSVKSNVGHCEAVGLFVSMAKAIIALDGGYVPPNINYASANENAAALKTGKIQVVTEKTRLTGDVVGISSFGTINAFSHVIIRGNNKVKRTPQNIDRDDILPRLLFASGRTEENALNTIQKIKIHGNDEEFVALTNNVFMRNINAHFYRSFSIYPNLDDSHVDDVWNVNLKKRPVWFIFSGMGSQWHGMGTHLMKLPVFADAINKCDVVLKPHGVDIKDILTSQNPKIFDNILNSFVGIAAVQIGLVEVLRALDVTPDGIVEHSVGELGCAYADGCFTAEEMILSAHARGRASLETELIPGMMAAIGLGYDQIKDKLPSDIDVACHNSNNSCTISGPVDSIEQFVSKLKSDGIFAKSVNVAGIAYHSRYIQSAGPTLLKYLKEVIREPKLRSSKWISSSVPESQWDSDVAKYSSPEYHTHNLLNSVLFEDALKHVPNDAIAIEIAPHGLLQAILREALPTSVTNIPLTKRMFGDSVRFLMAAIGKMYTSGLNPKIQEIYPKVTFPVSCGTPSIHSLPFWDHTQQWKTLVSVMNSKKHINSAERSSTIVLHEDSHLVEHRIHNEHFIPLSYILVKVWKTFVELYDKTFSKESIQFRDLRFKRDLKIHPINPSESYLMIQWGSGLFEYMVDNITVLTGQIAFLFDNDSNMKTNEMCFFDKTANDFEGSSQKNEIYDILERNGFNLGDNFKNITRCEIYKNTIQGYVKWNNDWIYFLDGLLKFPVLETIGAQANLEFPEFIREIRIFPKMFEKTIEKDELVNYNRATKDIVCNGIQMFGIKNSPFTVTNKSTAVKLEEKTFIHFNHSKCEKIKNFIDDTMDVILEAKTLGLESATEKLIVYTPHHYDNAIVKECAKSIKQIIENQTSFNSNTMSWENVRNQTDDDKSGTFITVTDVDYLKDTTKALANKTYCYIIVCSKHRLHDHKDWKIVTQQEYDVDNFLVLIKKKIPFDSNSVFITTANNYDNNMSIWKALEKTKGNVYIISKCEPSENDIKTILKKYKSQRVRFLFILDTDAPEFESAMSFYTDHLSIGSIVNIYKNGGWGSYKRLPHQNVKHDVTVSGSTMFEKFSTHQKNGLTITHLGLNFNDLVIENDTENSFGPFEYSGTIDNIKKVMGIATYDKLSSRLNYDKAFSWPVPSAWTSEDATTIPLSYALSYYVFNVLCSLKNDKSILITSGLHSIGQSAISICLAKKCETYAIVESNQQADHLSNIFPEMLRSRIVVNTNKVDIKLKLMKPSGFDYVLNFLSDESFQSAFGLIAKHGKFFQFSKSDMRNKSHIGTRRFLQNISMSVVSSDLLLNESDDTKQIVRQAFMNGLNKGVIKPYRYRVVPTSFGYDEIFNTMRTGSEKVVLRLNDSLIGSKPHKVIESLPYQMNSDHVYVIIGNKSNWLDLSEWLVDRGARKIVIVVNRYFMSSITYKRFDRILSRKVSVKIESDHQLRTDTVSRDWLNHMTSSGVLGSLFLVKQTDVKKIENLRYAFENHPNKTTKTSFICILSKGEHVCAKLKSNGLNAINITWDGVLSQPKQTAQILQSLDTLLRESHAKECSSFVCSELCSNELECCQQISDIITTFFPDSAEELQLLNDKLTNEVSFVEVQTKSPRFSQLKSVSPVFAIPGFKPKLISTLYKHCIYPIFEAQLPEYFMPVDELSEILVNKIKCITNVGCVSLIAESWGGIVALKMTQILEAQGILTTVALIESSPETMKSLAENYLSNDNFVNKLETLYSSFLNEFPKYELQNCDEKSYLKNDAFNQNALRKMTKRVLHAIRARLQAVLESKPLSNKLQTKVLMLKSRQFTNLNETTLNDYCVRSPLIYVTTEDDYKQMMTDKEMIEVFTKNSAHSYPTGVDLSLADKYRNFYFFYQNHVKTE